MTVTAKELAAALLTYETAIGEEPATLATRVNAMRQVLEQFEAGCMPPQMKVNPDWKPPSTFRNGPILAERAANLLDGAWEPGLEGIVARGGVPK